MHKIRQLIWKLFLKNRYYNKDGSPKKCKHCGSDSLFMYARGTEANVVSEWEHNCTECGYSVAYWAYGYFDPAYREYYK
jgi:hypothetical protein